MTEIKPRIDPTPTGTDLHMYPLCSGPKCPLFTCHEGNEYIDARCKIIREPIPRWQYYPCAPMLLRQRDKLGATIEKIKELAYSQTWGTNTRTGQEIKALKQQIRIILDDAF